MVIWTLQVLGQRAAVNWKLQQQAVVNQRQCCDWKWFKPHSLYEFIVSAVHSHREKNPAVHSGERRIRRATGTSIRRTLLQQWAISAWESWVLKTPALLFRPADVSLKLFCLRDHLRCFCSCRTELAEIGASLTFPCKNSSEFWDLWSPGRLAAISERQSFLFFSFFLFFFVVMSP